jgi:Chaperone of endosialidase
MGTTNKDTLKGYFKAGSIPKESNFADLIDSVLLMDGTGKVGVGIADPKQKIEIGGNGGLGFSGTGLNSADKKLYAPADGDLEWMTNNAAVVHGFAISHQGAKAVYLSTSGNSYLNGGNVGIGTVTPSGKLNISEPAGTAATAAGGTLILDHENIGGASSIVFRSKVNRGSDYGYIQYQDAATIGGAGESAILKIGIGNDGDDHISLMPSGNVGIGTDKPTHQFHVLGNDAVGLFESTGSSAYLRLSTNEGLEKRVEFTNRSGGRASIWVSAFGDAFNVLANGNVGIGTIAPTQKLEVAGNAKITGNIEAANSDIYFSNTQHNHTGIGNQPGWAAIENSISHNCLMILGRNTGPSASQGLLRVVKVWDQLWIAGAQVNVSDVREKTNVEPLQHGLSAIKELRPVRYNWLNNKEGQKSLGLIAQEVLPVVSEAVHYNESKPDEPGWGISYQSLIPVLINAIKELDLKIESIQTKRAEA